MLDRMQYGLVLSANDIAATVLIVTFDEDGIYPSQSIIHIDYDDYVYNKEGKTDYKTVRGIHLRRGDVVKLKVETSKEGWKVPLKDVDEIEQFYREVSGIDTDYKKEQRLICSVIERKESP